MLILQAKPLRDNPDYIPVCYRCGASNPLLNPFTSKFVKADVCTNCGHPFIRSFINFEVLPLVEFVPSRDISDDDAIDLIRQHPSDAEASLKSKKPSSGGGSKIDDDDVLIIDDENRVDMGEFRQTTDLFTNSINRALSQQVKFHDIIHIWKLCLYFIFFISFILFIIKGHIGSVHSSDS